MPIPFHPRGLSPPRRLAPRALRGLVASRIRSWGSPRFTGLRRIPVCCGPFEVFHVASGLPVTVGADRGPSLPSPEFPASLTSHLHRWLPDPCAARTRRCRPPNRSAAAPLPTHRRRHGACAPWVRAPVMRGRSPRSASAGAETLVPFGSGRGWTRVVETRRSAPFPATFERPKSLCRAPECSAHRPRGAMARGSNDPTTPRVPPEPAGEPTCP